MNNLSEKTDEELAMLYVKGETRAFDIILARNQSKIYTYIMYVVRNDELANDIFQDTFVKVISKLHDGKYQPTGKFSAWLLRIAHNLIMDHYRDTAQMGFIDQGEDNDLSNLSSRDMMDINRESQIVNEQIHRDVKRLMEELPQPQREVVYMRFYQNLSFKEIAEITGVSINTSLGRMRYAVMNMRRMARSHGISLQIA